MICRGVFCKVKRSTMPNGKQCVKHKWVLKSKGMESIAQDLSLVGTAKYQVWTSKNILHRVKRRELLSHAHTENDSETEREKM